MSDNLNDVLRQVNLRKIFLPVTIGVGVSLWLIWSNFDSSALRSIALTDKLLLGLVIAAVAVLVRDVAYIIRIREITGRQLSWYKCFEVIMLWEFGSAVTPGAVGGIALALFILKKEGISYGRSTATIMLTTFFDNLAFVLVFSTLYILFGAQMFLINSDCGDLKGHIILQALSNAGSKAWIGFALMLFFTVLLGFGLFIAPHWVRRHFYARAEMKILSRWKDSLRRVGDELETTAQEFSQQSFSFFARIAALTIITWLARYLLANALIFAFAQVDLNQLYILSRQYVLWVFLIIPSTPGASGLAELSFMAMNCEFIPQGLSAAVAVVWRVYSYYAYLLIGMLVLPRWMARITR